MQLFRRRKIKPLDLEEVLFANDQDTIELPLSLAAFRLLLGMVACIIIAAAGRLVYLNVFRGDFYVQRAVANANQVHTIEAGRGIIFDRFGNPLVKNIPSFGVVLHIPQFLKESSADREKIKMLLAGANIITQEEFSRLMENVNVEKTSEIFLARHLKVEQAIAVKELQYDAVSVEEDNAREYIDGPEFSSVLGYVGLVSRDDLKRSESLFPNDLIGRGGLELQYDTILRGTSGKFILHRDAKGTILDQQMLQSAETGSQLTLTIDSELQRYFYERMRDRLATLGRSSGVGIAVNPQTGEVLSLLSFPGYDNNAFSDPQRSGERKDILLSGSKPLFNRAVEGAYSPGSTIKPLVALAALKEGVVTPDKSIFSPGYLDIPNPYNPDQPTRLLDWRPQGWVDVHSALAKSSNVYFYVVGGGFGDVKGLGIERLQAWWRKFGFGAATGIDMPREAAGFLPNPNEKEARTGKIWLVGDTYNVSIGQGDLLVTPIQLLNYISAIANGGTFWKPFVVKEVKDARGKVIKDTQPQRDLQHTDWGSALDDVRQGMEDVVTKSYGTGYSLHDLPFRVVAKSGTAQTNLNAKNNALFVAYAPAENPRIAVLVLVEDVPEGQLGATPVAKDVLRWYYENRIQKNETH